MKPTNEQVRDWAIRCGDEWGSTLPEDKRFLAAVAALAYAAGAEAMKERAVKICEIEASASLEISNASDAYQEGRAMGATVCKSYISALMEVK